jgi:hypothetical protein
MDASRCDRVLGSGGIEGGRFDPRRTAVPAALAQRIAVTGGSLTVSGF